jgi:hypothetical protein
MNEQILYILAHRHLSKGILTYLRINIVASCAKLVRDGPETSIAVGLEHSSLWMEMQEVHELSSLERCNMVMSAACYFAGKEDDGLYTPTQALVNCRQNHSKWSPSMYASVLWKVMFPI